MYLCILGTISGDYPVTSIGTLEPDYFELFAGDATPGRDPTGILVLPIPLF
jgi:hypothetical protein